MALHVWALAGPLGLLAPADVCFAVGLVAVVGSFSNWLHHAFHLEGHWMERCVAGHTRCSGSRTFLAAHFPEALL